MGHDLIWWVPPTHPLSCRKTVFGFGVKYLFMFSLPGLTPEIPFSDDIPREAVDVRSGLWHIRQNVFFHLFFSFFLPF